MWLTNKDTNTVNNGGSTPSDRRGGGNSDPEIREGPVSKKILFRPFGPQFGLKIRAGRGGAGRAPGPIPPLDPPLVNGLNPGVISRVG